MMLGVPEALIAQYGAVSREVAVAMACGMRERAHVGSAAWIDSAGMTGEFMHGVNVDANAARRFEEVQRSGGRYERLHGAVITD